MTVVDRDIQSEEIKHYKELIARVSEMKDIKEKLVDDEELITPGFRKFITLYLSYNGTDIEIEDLDQIYRNIEVWRSICEKFKKSNQLKELQSLIETTAEYGDYSDIENIDFVDDIRYLAMLPSRGNLFGEFVSEIIAKAKLKSCNKCYLLYIVSELSLVGKIHSFEDFEDETTYNKLMQQFIKEKELV